MITTTYLEISDLARMRSMRAHGTADKRVQLEKPGSDAACTLMYSAVGKAYYWDLYRIGWTGLDWSRYLRHPDIEVSLICNADGDRIGYLELRAHADGSVEIVNFGLVPEFTGKGHGRAALALAIGRALERRPSRVWLHTCSLDHPRALRTYYSCGFRFLSEKVTDYLPLDTPPGTADPALACLNEAGDATSSAA